MSFIKSLLAGGRNYPWLVVGLLWLVCFFNYADRQAISSIFPLLENQFGFDKMQLALIGSIFAWVYAGGAPFAGIVADRYSRKTIILGACLVWSFFTLATAWCNGLNSFLIVRSLTGLGECLYFPAAMSLLSDYHSRRTRSTAMSWHQSSVYIGTIMGSWMAGALAQHLGWRFPFYLFGPIGVLLALLLLFFLREPARENAGTALAMDKAGLRETAPSFRENLVAILSRPAAIFLMLAFVAANFVAVIFLTWTPLFLVDKFHFSLGAAGLGGTLFIQLASALAVPLAGCLADGCARRWVSGRMLVQLGGLLTGVFFVFLIGLANSVITLIVAMSAYGICKGFYDAGIFASLYDVVPIHARGTAAGLMNTMGWSGGALGPLYVGWMAKHGDMTGTMANMSRAIELGSIAYVLAAVFMLAAIFAMPKLQRS